MKYSLTILLFLLLAQTTGLAQSRQQEYQQDLEVYLTVSEDKPASIVCDLGLEMIAPADGFPVCGAIAVWLKQPDENGLPSDTELDLMVTAEEKMGAQLTQAANAYYAGRVLFDGSITFYFYTQDSTKFLRYAKSAVRSALPAYEFNLLTEPDEQWEIYTEMLYPDAESMNAIENRRVIERLETAGDRLSKPRTITHTALFETESGRQEFEQSILKLRFKLEGKSKNSGEMPYELTFSRRDAIEEDYINKITWELCQLADKSNGFYDGWDSPIYK